MRQGDEVYYLHGDHLGSVSLVTDSEGEVVSEARYTPYGRLREGSIGPTDIGFTNQRHEEFGLVDYGARLYDPYLGRFISPDTVVPEAKNPQAWNRYSYVGNNPLKYIDPSGHCWGFASGMRDSFYGTTCNNLDMAAIIVTSPDATIGQKLGAGTYIGVEATAHVTVVAGLAVAGVGCLTGAGTVVCAGAGTAATAVSADGDPTNEAIATGDALTRAACADGDCTNEVKSVIDVGNRAQTIQNTINTSTEVVKFTNTAAKHLQNPSRYVPTQLLDSVVKSPETKWVPDPQGIEGAQRTVVPFVRNGTDYLLEIVYNPTTNTILHFQYGSSDKIAPLR